MKKKIYSNPQTEAVILRLETNILSGEGILNPPSGGGTDEVMQDPFNPYDPYAG